MTDRIALVTGGNGGIGFEVVRALAARGMTVYLGSRDAEQGRGAAAALSDAGDVRPLHIDHRDESTLAPAIAEIERAHGRLDILVNNAGIAPGGSVLDVSPDVVRDSFQVNLHGPVRLTQLAVPLLRKGTEPRIVNTSSSAGTFGFMANTDPSWVPYAYVVAKAALNAATVTLASALKADGVKVNAACPGLVNTKLSAFMGDRGPIEGAKIIVELATLGEDGPTGGFFDEAGPKDW